jgi:hypothetical protein
VPYVGREHAMRKNEWQLQVLVKQAYGELNRIGRSIIDHACIEVCQVIDEIDEIMNSPLIEKYGTAFGGFCSLSGRLAGVMSTMAKIGDVACEEAKSSRDASDHKIPHLFQMMHIPVESCIHEQQLRRQLEAYVQRFRGLSEDLKRLIGMDVQFITCDAYVYTIIPSLPNAMRSGSALRKLQTVLQCCRMNGGISLRTPKRRLMPIFGISFRSSKE